MKAYDSWKNCEKSVPQLVGEIQAMTIVKYSSRWYVFTLNLNLR